MKNPTSTFCQFPGLRFLRRSYARCVCALLLSLVALQTACAAPAPSANAEVQKLTGILKSQAPQKEKADACRELARIADRSAIASLAALLNDESLSHMARYALETIPDPEVDKVFRAAAEKLQGRPLVGVIGSIGVRRDEKAVKQLAGLLNNANSDVAQAAARALGRIGSPAAAKAIKRILPTTAQGNLLAFSEGLFRCAENLLNNGNRKEAASIYDSLRTSQAGHQVRTAALRGAILAREQKGLPLLKEALASKDYPVFATAARTSLEMKGASTTEALTAALPTAAAADRQILIIQTLATRHDPSCLPALLNSAKTSEPVVRVAALRAISEFQEPSSIPVLTQLMLEQDKQISQAAQEALAGHPGSAADQAVLAMLRGKDAAQRTTAMDLVVRRRIAGAKPDLYQLASSPDQKVRSNAVRKLAEISDDAEVPGILKLLSNAQTPEDLEVSEQAITAVSLRARDREIPARTIATALANAKTSEKSALLRVLTALATPGALKSVRGAVNDTAPEVRGTAIRALGSWNSAETAPDLLQLARSASDPTDKALSLRSYIGLASQSDLSAEARLNICREAATLVQSPEEKKLLLGALGGIQSQDTMQLIAPYLKDTATKDEASAAILAVASKLLEGNEAARNAPGVAQALENATQEASDQVFAAKAKPLIEKAKARASK